jgi:hypothetical protein
VDPSLISFTLLYHFTFTCTIYFLAYYYLLPLDTLNPLFTANRWDWQPHRKLGAKFLVMLCAGSTLLLVQSKALDEAPYKLSGAVAKLASITFWSLAFSYWFDKPWFHNWGKTCYCAHHTFLLGSQRAVTYTPSSNFLAPLPGRKRISARRVSHAQSFTLLLFYFILLLLASFYQKYKKISSLIVFTYFSAF